MKLLISLLFAACLCAQTATRQVTLEWTASTSTGVTGYSVSRGTSPSGPFTVLTPTPIAGTTFTDTATVGQTYTYQVVAVAPDCTPTTPVTQACGTSAPAAATANVPPKPNVTVTLTITIP